MTKTQATNLIKALRSIGLRGRRVPTGVVSRTGDIAEMTIKRIASAYDARCRFTRDAIGQAHTVILLPRRTR